MPPKIQESKGTVRIELDSLFLDWIDDHMDSEFLQMEKTTIIMTPVEILEQKIRHTLTDIQTFA